MFNWLSKRAGSRRIASALYSRIVAQSRLSDFYVNWRVPDTLEGRFEVLVLHVFLVLEGLRGRGTTADQVAQNLVDAYFTDMDTTMRELGVGDLAVPKKIRKLAAVFYERLADYKHAASNEPSLAKQIDSHIFEGENPESAQILASYARRTLADWRNRAQYGLFTGEIEFAALGEPPATDASAQ